MIKSNKLSRVNPIIASISILIGIIYFFIYLYQGNYSFAALCVFVVIHPLVIPIVNKIFHYKINTYIKFTYFSLIFMGAVLGSVMGLYNYISFFDNITHFISGILIAGIIPIIYKSYHKDNKINYNVLTMLIIISVAASAVFWEIYEYLSDTFLKTNAQKGLIDTMQDMISAILGSLVFIVLFINRKKN